MSKSFIPPKEIAEYETLVNYQPINERSQQLRVVTAEQLKAGYFEMKGGIVFPRQYKVIRKRSEDGTYIVEEPITEPPQP